MRTGGETKKMTTIRPKSATWIILALLPLMIIGCQLGSEPQPAPRPLPPPTPTLEERRIQTPTDFGGNTRVVDGDIHVWHVPRCPPVPPATWVASIILTDLRSGSHLYLNGTVPSETLPHPITAPTKAGSDSHKCWGTAPSWSSSSPPWSAPERHTPLSVQS